MTDPTSETAPELTITRVFDAPRDLVFAAWTDPEQVARWWGPRDFTTPAATLDVTPGGGWRTCIRSTADGAEYWSHGVYREVSPPERLVFTFVWEDEHNPETLVTVTFAAEGDKTRMTFHQTPFISVEERDSHREGWSECFDDLAAALARA